MKEMFDRAYDDKDGEGGEGGTYYDGLKAEMEEQAQVSVLYTANVFFLHHLCFACNSYNIMISPELCTHHNNDIKIRTRIVATFRCH